jgi:NTP pyrophosphatase (non-canonical NTP hydrolase)
MNVAEHLITVLAEECGEVAHDCSKALRFGLDDVNCLTPGGPTNRERIAKELNQLFASIELCQETGLLPANFLDREIIEAKKAAVARYMDYAREKGALE